MTSILIILCTIGLCTLGAHLNIKYDKQIQLDKRRRKLLGLFRQYKSTGIIIK